jgi:hypothetical protein
VAEVLADRARSGHGAPQPFIANEVSGEAGSTSQSSWDVPTGGLLRMPFSLASINEGTGQDAEMSLIRASPIEHDVQPLAARKRKPRQQLAERRRR